MADSFRGRLKRGDFLFGTMVTLPCPSVAELLSNLGFDWLFIDGEHGPLEVPDIQSILQVLKPHTAGIVRVPSCDEAAIKRVLDIGATGVIVPQVNSVEEAERVVQASRYAPQGSRGVGLARAHGYGMTFGEYLRTANDHVTVIVQAEHARAVEQMEAIVKVNGIDAVLIGPYDLSASLGKMGQIEDPVVTDAIDHVTSTCRAAGIPLGIFGVTPDAVSHFVDEGYRMVVVGVDTMLLGAAAQTVLHDLRGLRGRQ